MLTLDLAPDVQRRLSELARRTGRSESDWVKELIEENIDDIEDRLLAESRLAEQRTPLSSAQLRETLGLDD